MIPVQIDGNKSTSRYQLVNPLVATDIYLYFVNVLTFTNGLTASLA